MKQSRKLKTNELENIFAARVDEARKRAGLTVAALSKKSGLSYVAVVHILRRQCSPSLSMVQRLSRALSAKEAQLLESKREEFIRLMNTVSAREAHHILNILHIQHTGTDTEIEW